MNFEITSRLSGAALTEWRELVSSAGLSAEDPADRTVLVYDGGTLVATGARDGAILKMLAVGDSHRGCDLTSAVLTLDEIKEMVDEMMEQNKEYLTQFKTLK